MKTEDNASLTLEFDKNKSENLITALYRERSKMRQQVEELKAAIEKLEEDIELQLPLKEKVKKEKSVVEKEWQDLQSKIKDAETPLKSLEKENKPLFDEYLNHQAEQKNLEAKLDVLAKEANALGGDLNALSKEREVAQENYISKREEILMEVKHPGYLYYGDETEVFISSKAPSGKGVFINQGRGSGIREGMLFLVKKSQVLSGIPLYLKSTIVEDKFSFLELLTIGKSQNELTVNDGEKLFLIRTGDSNTSE
jgi:DNA gyrase/topoisomerase IV subunit A